MMRVQIYHGMRDGYETFDYWADTVKIVTVFYQDGKWWIQVFTNPETPWFVQCNPKSATEVTVLINQLLPFILKQLDQPYLDLTNEVEYMRIIGKCQ